jgi:predicted SprT family Zn-dependent metalloprotease
MSLATAGPGTSAATDIWTREDLEALAITTVIDRLKMSVPARYVHETLDALNLTVVWVLTGSAYAGKMVTKPGEGSKVGRQYVIQLNSDYLAVEGADRYAETVVHEACHVVTEICRHRTRHADPKSEMWRSHGTHWSEQMIACGYLPTRCADKETAAGVRALVEADGRTTRTQPKANVLCGCPDGVDVSTTIAGRMEAGKRYSCVKCRQILVLKDGKVGKAAASKTKVKLPSNWTEGWS